MYIQKNCVILETISGDGCGGSAKTCDMTVVECIFVFFLCFWVVECSTRLSDTHTLTLLNEFRHRNLSRKTVRISSTVISWFLLIVLSTSVSTFGFNDNDASVSVRVFGKLGACHDSARNR